MSERLSPDDIKKLRVIEWKLDLAPTMGEQLQEEYMWEAVDRKAEENKEEGGFER